MKRNAQGEEEKARFAVECCLTNELLSQLSNILPFDIFSTKTTLLLNKVQPCYAKRISTKVLFRLCRRKQDNVEAPPITFGVVVLYDIRLYRENAIVIQNESGDSNGGNV